MSWLPLPRAVALALGGGGISALLAEKRLVEPDQQRRREAFFKQVVRQILIGVIFPGEPQSQ
jgi:hypothetical protein